MVRSNYQDLQIKFDEEGLADVFNEIEYRRTTEDLFEMAIKSKNAAEALLEIKRRKLERDFDTWKHINNKQVVPVKIPKLYENVKPIEKLELIEYRK